MFPPARDVQSTVATIPIVTVARHIRIYFLFFFFLPFLIRSSWEGYLQASIMIQLPDKVPSART